MNSLKTKIFRKLYGKGKFVSQTAYGAFAAKEYQFRVQQEKKHRRPVDEETMNAFYETEWAHLDDYTNQAAEQIQSLVQEVTDENMRKINEENTEHIIREIRQMGKQNHIKRPMLQSIEASLIAAFIWDALLVVITIICVNKFDVFREWVFRILGTS